MTIKRYCFDTSGISNPLEFMPEDIYGPIWAAVEARIRAGIFAVTHEIYLEMERIGGSVGQCIVECRSLMVLDLADDSWDWEIYANHLRRMQIDHRQYISEYSGSSKKTICLNDLTGVALAKSLGLPIVSMEGSAKASPKHKRIPDICALEQVDHLTFNDFLRREGIRLT